VRSARTLPWRETLWHARRGVTMQSSRITRGDVRLGFAWGVSLGSEAREPCQDARLCYDAGFFADGVANRHAIAALEPDFWPRIRTTLELRVQIPAAHLQELVNAVRAARGLGQEGS
jgi:hypothetical protein